MDKLKPIEAGCLAVVYNSDCGNDGIVVTCIEYIGELNSSWETDLWLTDTMMKCYYFDGRGNREERAADDPLMSESKLMRIDGGDFEEESEERLALIEDIGNE